MDSYDAIHRLGQRRAGVWTRAEARELGLSDDQIDRLLASGEWRPWFGGPVYSAAGTPDTWLTRLRAASCRVGEDAVASRRTAARLWRLPDFDETETLEFVVPRGHTPRIAGIAVARTIHLPQDDVVRHSGARATSVTRTLHDLAAVLDDRRLLLAAAEGWRLGRTDPVRLLSSLAARPGLPGNARLRRVLGQLDPRLARTRSVAEIIDVLVLRGIAGIPPFAVNVWLELPDPPRRQADVLFPPNAVLEVQSDAYHGDPIRRQADAERRRQLEAAGYVVREVWASELRDAARVRAVVVDLLTSAGIACDLTEGIPARP